jgi:hypothetical protein
MALRTFKTETLTGEQAMTKLREGINREILVRGRAEGTRPGGGRRGGEQAVGKRSAQQYATGWSCL